ncbi:hypothetical protein SVIOM74S_00736 [Streptomyces violarus]
MATIRSYHDVAVRPFADQIHARLEAKRSSPAATSSLGASRGCRPGSA